MRKHTRDCVNARPWKIIHTTCAYFSVHTKPRDWDSFGPDGIIRTRRSQRQRVYMLIDRIARTNNFMIKPFPVQVRKCNCPSSMCESPEVRGSPSAPAVNSWLSKAILKISLFPITWCENVHAVAIQADTEMLGLLLLYSVSQCWPLLPPQACQAQFIPVTPTISGNWDFPIPKLMRIQNVARRRYRHGRFHLLQKGILSHTCRAGN